MSQNPLRTSSDQARWQSAQASASHAGSQDIWDVEMLAHAGVFMPYTHTNRPWRAICARILRQTRTIANIQLVEVDDYGTTWQELQGNEDGPSN